MLSARHGNATQGGVLYTTLRPCFGCVKEAIQAGIGEFVFDDPFSYPDELEGAFADLIEQSGIELRRVPLGAAGA